MKFIKWLIEFQELHTERQNKWLTGKENIMCALLDAEDLLRMYDYDRTKAAADGAEREFIEAEVIVEQERIDIYDQMMGIQ